MSSTCFFTSERPPISVSQSGTSASASCLRVWDRTLVLYWLTTRSNSASKESFEKPPSNALLDPRSLGDYLLREAAIANRSLAKKYSVYWLMDTSLTSLLWKLAGAIKSLIISRRCSLVGGWSSIRLSKQPTSSKRVLICEK